jgi:hypothetical protein
MRLAFAVLLTALSCKQTGSSAPPSPSTATPPPQGTPAPPQGTPAPPQGTVAAPPSAAPVADDISCTKDEDCVPAPGCCPVPCTSRVVNRRDLPRIQATLATCDRSRCVSAGGCRTHAYLCVKSACALVFDGDPGYHAR